MRYWSVVRGIEMIGKKEADKIKNGIDEMGNKY